MSIRQDIGPVSAYALAKEKGYQGTEEEFEQAMANVGTNIGEIKEAIDTFNDVTVPTATQAVTDEGIEQVGLVNAAGTTQVEAVEEKGTIEIGAVEAAGTAQVGAVNSAGSTQVGNVNTAGGTQVAAVQAKGDEVIASIPADYSELTQEVSDLNQAFTNYADFVTDTFVGKTEWAYGYVENGTGNIVDATAFVHTIDLLDTSKRKNLLVDASFSYNALFLSYYDANRNYLNNADISGTSADIPAKAFYVRINYFVGRQIPLTDANNVRIILGEIKSDEILDAYNKSRILEENCQGVIKINADWENGGYNSSGETSSASQIRTKFIPTDKKTRLLDITYTVPDKGVTWFYVLFDETKNILSISNAFDFCDTIVVPDTAAFVRVIMTIGNPTVYTDGQYLDLAFLPLTKWYGKKISVYGDSLSTFNGTSVSGNTAYYPNGNLNRLQETWWYRLIRKLGATLETCNAYGGSSVTAPNDNTYMADSARLATLGNPDMILFCGGTNDIYMARAIGEWKGWKISDLESFVSQFIPAYTKCLSYMQETYDCKILAVTPCFIASDGHPGRENITLDSIENYCEAIKKTCAYMGVDFMDTRKVNMTIHNIADYTIDELHWNVCFTTVLAEAIYQKIINCA